MTVVHQIIGYDRRTECEVVNYDVPRAYLDFVKKLAGVESDDPDAVGSYPLTQNQAMTIIHVIGKHLVNDFDGIIYFLEPYEDEDISLSSEETWRNNSGAHNS